ncbi:hypothetical protein BHM03_00017205 [Ensete ventricosum]|nr:hypothetical protein BHM03_00017205 [Ensete ventricosum]
MSSDSELGSGGRLLEWWSSGEEGVLQFGSAADSCKKVGSFYSGCYRSFVPDDLTAFMTYHAVVPSTMPSCPPTMLVVLAMRRAFAGGGCRPYLCQVGCTTIGAPRISGRLPASGRPSRLASCPREPDDGEPGADASDGRGSLAADACGCDPDVAGESASRGFQSTVAPFRTRACRSLLSAFGESWHFFNQVLYVVIGIMFAGKWTQFIADSSPADAAYESGGLKPEVLRSFNPLSLHLFSSVQVRSGMAAGY